MCSLAFPRSCGKHFENSEWRGIIKSAVQDTRSVVVFVTDHACRLAEETIESKTFLSGLGGNLPCPSGRKGREDELPGRRRKGAIPHRFLLRTTVVMQGNGSVCSKRTRNFQPQRAQRFAQRYTEECLPLCTSVQTSVPSAVKNTLQSSNKLTYYPMQIWLVPTPNKVQLAVRE